MSASLSALLVLLYDSLNYCNTCFSSGGGLEACESQSIRATHAKGKARHHMLRLRSKSQRITIIYSESLSMRDVLYMEQGERFTLQSPGSSLSLSVLLESTHYKMLVKASTD